MGLSVSLFLRRRVVCSTYPQASPDRDRPPQAESPTENPSLADIGHALEDAAGTEEDETEEGEDSEADAASGTDAAAVSAAAAAAAGWPHQFAVAGSYGAADAAAAAAGRGYAPEEEEDEYAAEVGGSAHGEREYTTFFYRGPAGPSPPPPRPGNPLAASPSPVDVVGGGGAVGGGGSHLRGELPSPETLDEDLPFDPWSPSGGTSAFLRGSRPELRGGASQQLAGSAGGSGHDLGGADSGDEIAEEEVASGGGAWAEAQGEEEEEEAPPRAAQQQRQRQQLQQGPDGYYSDPQSQRSRRPPLSPAGLAAPGSHRATRGSANLPPQPPHARAAHQQQHPPRHPSPGGSNPARSLNDGRGGSADSSVVENSFESDFVAPYDHPSSEFAGVAVRAVHLLLFHCFGLL